MPRAVVDTSVIIAAKRSRAGASAAVVALVGAGRFDLIMSTAMALEYEHVLKRDALSIGVTPAEIDEFVGFLCAHAVRHEPAPFPVSLSTDADDEFVARLAASSGSDYLVTHNLRDFRDLAGAGIRVVTPAQFLPIIRNTP